MSQAEEHEGPVVRDRRRIDPRTGEIREEARATAPSPDAGEAADTAATGEPGGGAEEAPAVSAAEVEALKAAVVERTNDLKRLQAEYVNYKRRVDRDRQANQEQAVGSVLTELLPVLDDIGRAREHDELSGGFKAVAEALETSLSKLGLVKFGEVGEEFDPRIHDALMHAYSDDVSGPTCSAILQPGYRLGERVLRPARVAVTEPTVGLPPEQAAPSVDADAASGAESGSADDEGATAGADDQPPTGNG
ncbi:nucleotide exchange factor GrpE [Actinopolymorpha singaporensis]|uniref:Protein GrpE n=1 Tax=Actinopolymorpha singaporensis TaxID=117157 RepID=A0A1H1NSX9_9ACTN|nr:nucleotide exchange factor GrpE [Actinopolymorpha singaporensis]SDS02077.1 molecular chaperone GrpE [Actinopolymorpha singaporensis]